MRSFRTVSRVHEDSRPFSVSPTSYNAPYPPVGLGGPYTAAPPKNRHDNQNPRAPSPSPSISVEAFRAASARNQSSSSLYSPRSPEQPERPRFEPTRSNRSSVGNFDSLTSARRSSYIESNTPSSPTHLGALTHPPAKMTTAESSYSLASFKSALSTTSDDAESHTRDRTISADELDEELRLIAMYGSGEVSSTQNRRQSFGSTQALKPVYNAKGPPPPRPAARITPSLALVPASPDPPMQIASKRSSRISLSATSTRSFGERTTQVNWNDDSDDEDEDDMPLATLSDTRRKSQSMISLLLPPSPLLANAGGAKERWSVDMDRRTSHQDQEILTEEATSSPGSSARGGRQPLRESTTPSNAPRPVSSAGSSSTLPRKADVGRQISRRSMSTLSFGSKLTPTPPSAPIRTFSTPTSTFGIIPPIPFSNNVESNPSQERDSANSSSTSDSSLPKTPKDGSPGGSMLGMRVGSGLKDSSYTSDDTILAMGLSNGALSSSNGKGQRNSLAPLENGSVAGQSRNVAGAQRLPQRSSQQFATLPRNTSYLPSPSPSPSRSVADFRSQSAPNSPRLPLHSRAGSAGQGEQYERMRVRHKAEALNAIAIGRDLNGSGLMDDDDEEDDVPLASIPSKRGSVAGSSYGAPSNQQQQHQFPSFAPQGFPQFSQIPSTAPPGVDPYLYAALPADQKMNLHFRSQQMLQIMAQASYQAKAESEMGWDNSSAISGSGGEREQQRRYSVGGMPGMGYGMPMPSNRLPPFAPSNSASQAFFQSQPLPSHQSQFFNPYQTQFQAGYGMYGNGTMSGAQSAIGVSTMGNAEKRGSYVPKRAAASTIGTRY